MTKSFSLVPVLLALACASYPQNNVPNDCRNSPSRRTKPIEASVADMLGQFEIILVDTGAADARVRRGRLELHRADSAWRSRPPPHMMRNVERQNLQLEGKVDSLYTNLPVIPAELDAGILYLGSRMMRDEVFVLTPIFSVVDGFYGQFRVESSFVTLDEIATGQPRRLPRGYFCAVRAKRDV